MGTVGVLSLEAQEGAGRGLAHALVEKALEGLGPQEGKLCCICFMTPISKNITEAQAA